MASTIDVSEFTTRLVAIRRTIEHQFATTEVAGRTARLLRRLEASLARPVRVAVLGETNSGKTSLVNVLLGDDLLSTDVIANTRLPVLVHHAPQPSLELVDETGRRQAVAATPIADVPIGDRTRLEVGVPLAQLVGVEIVDTPGFGSDDPSLADPQTSWASRADVGIWCTIATQAWRATEVSAWQGMARAPSSSLLAATRADLLDTADREKVMARLSAEAGGLFRAIVMVDAAKPAGNADLTRSLEAAVAGVREARLARSRNIVHRVMEQLRG